MDEFRDESKFKHLTPEQVESWLMGTFLFALVWSFGASTGNDGRAAFDVLVRELSKVFMHIHTYVCTYVRMCKCTYVYYVHSYVHMHVHACICMYICMYIHAYICMYVCMYVHVYICMYICMYVHAYMCVKAATLSMYGVNAKCTVCTYVRTCTICCYSRELMFRTARTSVAMIVEHMYYGSV